MFYEELFKALEKAQVRYLVVGGVAMVLHGFIRMTMDLDLFIALDPSNIERFLKVVQDLGYRPDIPVKLEDFSSTKKRQEWRNEKGMLVFPLSHPVQLNHRIDVFIEEQLPFIEAYERRFPVKVQDCTVQVASVNDLVAMKRKAGRAQDLEDIEALKRLGKLNESGK